MRKAIWKYFLLLMLPMLLAISRAHGDLVPWPDASSVREDEKKTCKPGETMVSCGRNAYACTSYESDGDISHKGNPDYYFLKSRFGGPSYYCKRAGGQLLPESSSAAAPSTIDRSPESALPTRQKPSNEGDQLKFFMAFMVLAGGLVLWRTRRKQGS